jgi:hypothetical protein
VWFHAQKDGHAKPKLRVFQTGLDGSRTGYTVEIERVFEIRGNDTSYRTISRMKLTDADDWNVKTSETSSTLTITMTRAEAQGIVTLIFHVSKLKPAVKFDVKIDNWRWGENASAHRLALSMKVHSKDLKKHGEAAVAVPGGAIAWDTVASARYGPNSTKTLTVHRVAASAEDDKKDGAQRIVLVFGGAPGGYSGLVYDPTFSVASAEIAPVPGPAAGFVLVAVAAAATVAAGSARRRRR